MKNNLTIMNFKNSMFTSISTRNFLRFQTIDQWIGWSSPQYHQAQLEDKAWWVKRSLGIRYRTSARTDTGENRSLLAYGCEAVISIKVGIGHVMIFVEIGLIQIKFYVKETQLQSNFFHVMLCWINGLCWKLSILIIMSIKLF